MRKANKGAQIKANHNKTPLSNEKSDAATLLKADHRKVELLFQQYETEGDIQRKSAIARQVCQELIVHTKIEEELFYPACREKGVEDEALNEAQVEHDGAKMLIAELMEDRPDDEFYDAKVKVLSDYIKHHVGEEEKSGTGIFAKAQDAGVDMEGLGVRLQARKGELLSQIESLSSRPPKPRALHFRIDRQPQENERMARYDNDRDRDERGRFTSDEDRGYGRGSGNYRERDEQGRFTADDERNGGRSYNARNRDYDDDRGSRGHGGWAGDPEGHSRASREGWDERGGSRSRGYEDQDRGYRGRNAGGGEGRGWYGDPEGHSRASREGWDERGSSRSSSSRDYDDDNRGYRGRNAGGHGGWFGDPEGHSRASREGWDERGSSRSRSRDEDDDRGRGHGGWFGDPRGHAEASREGWRNR